MPRLDINVSGGPLSRLTRWKVNFTINSTLVSPFYPLQYSPTRLRKGDNPTGRCPPALSLNSQEGIQQICERQKEYYKLQKEIPDICKVNTQRTFGFIVTNWKGETKAHVWCLAWGTEASRGLGFPAHCLIEQADAGLTLVGKNIRHNALRKSACPNFTQFLSPNGYI